MELSRTEGGRATQQQLPLLDVNDVELHGETKSKLCHNVSPTPSSLTDARLTDASTLTLSGRFNDASFTTSVSLGE